MGYLPLVQKDSVTHVLGLAFYVKLGLPFARDLSIENSASTYVFDMLYFTQSLTFFSSVDHVIHLYAQFLMVFP